MIVHLYSLRSTVNRTDAVSVNVKTPQGEITILDHHRPLITFVEPGAVRIVGRNGEQTAVEAPRGGFVEVRPDNEVNVLLD